MTKTIIQEVQQNRRTKKKPVYGAEDLRTAPKFRQLWSPDTTVT